MSRLVIPIGTNDHVQGSANSKWTLVEYGDYQCPACGQAYPIVKKLQERLGYQLLFVFRNFPLREIHPNAQHAAETAEFAAAYGSFSQMHDALFENQEDLQDELLVGLAAKIGLSAHKLRRSLESESYRGPVEFDFLGGVRSGVNETPSFFINGVRHDGSFDFETFFTAFAEAN
ncbi:MAG: disulfide bond formation protein DsbA [Acidobacteria bacterium]|nr:MAG: disulfide bond formation protein DsbA [Acidobacteriota bacterium]